MNTMKWLMKREFWEHKGGFFWAPAVVGTILVLVMLVSAIAAVSLGRQHGIHINGDELSSITNAMDATQRATAVSALTNHYMGTAAPLFMVLSFVVFFFCLGALFDERKDRSVLFWKSLPVSDGETVLSKVATALVVAPVITLVIATITAVLSLLFICLGATAAGVNVLGEVFSSSATYLAPLQLAAILPVYVLWALPTVGWLIMVSAWARTKPFLWAVGVPLLTGALLSWFNAMFSFNWDIAWFWQHIVARGLLSVFPGMWFAQNRMPNGGDIGAGLHDNPMSSLLSQSWQSLGSPDVWIGVALGAAMIFTAVRLRRWKDEG